MTPCSAAAKLLRAQIYRQRLRLASVESPPPDFFTERDPDPVDQGEKVQVGDVVFDNFVTARTAILRARMQVFVGLVGEQQ
jgi:hypothetical protein